VVGARGTPGFAADTGAAGLRRGAGGVCGVLRRRGDRRGGVAHRWPVRQRRVVGVGSVWCRRLQQPGAGRPGA